MTLKLFTIYIVATILLCCTTSSLVMANPFKVADTCTGVTYITKENTVCSTATGATSVCAPGMECFDGKCKTIRFFNGKGCSSTLQCYQNTQSPQSFCINRRCQYINRFEGDPCVSDMQCFSSLCLKGKCAAKKVGEACTGGSTTNFCVMDAVCSNNVCTALRSEGESCEVVNGGVESVSCKSGLICDENKKCVKQVTRLGATCNPKYSTTHCSPNADRYCRTVPAAEAGGAVAFQCANYAKLNEKCDTTKNLLCAPGLTCDPNQLICLVNVKVCTGANGCGSETCYCGGKSSGSCGTFSQRNCAMQFKKLDTCLKANCNPYRISPNIKLNIADGSNCIARKCKAQNKSYYDCMAADMKERGLSLPLIQGYNSASTASVPMITVLISLVVYYFLLF